MLHTLFRSTSVALPILYVLLSAGSCDTFGKFWLFALFPATSNSDTFLNYINFTIPERLADRTMFAEK
jgi:hypothetical protein